jgi:flagellar basal-body rod protein FlgG
MMPDSTDAYTRAGAFSLSPDGQIVTEKGYIVVPGIAIPQDALSVTINAVGQVQALVAGSNVPQILGQLELARFPNDSGLQAIGDNLFTESPASGAVLTGLPGSPGFGTLQQGFLETSNVNAVQEITDLITAQRAYEMNSKIISAADEMLQISSQMS